MSIFRDIRASVITAAGLAVALSVVQGWNWPVVGDNARWGIVVLGAVSLVACTASGWATEATSTWYGDPFLMGAALIGGATLVVGVLGLVAGTQPYLLWMMAGTVLLWLISTTRHVIVALTPPAGRLTAA